MKSIYPYRVLSTVAETGKIAAAAEILHLTPSAVSHMILSLEEELGFSVFRRNRSGVELTDNGARILPLVRAVIREQENLEQRASNIAGVHDGRVRVGAFYSITMNWLVEIFSRFRTRYPNIEIQFYEGGYQDILRWVELNMVDIVFLGDRVVAGYDFIPLYMDEIKCVDTHEQILSDINVPCVYMHAKENISETGVYLCAASLEQAKRAVGYIGDECKLIETSTSDHTIHAVHSKEYIDAINSLLNK